MSEQKDFKTLLVQAGIIPRDVAQQFEQHGLIEKGASDAPPVFSKDLALKSEEEKSKELEDFNKSLKHALGDKLPKDASERAFRMDFRREDLGKSSANASGEILPPGVHVIWVPEGGCSEANALVPCGKCDGCKKAYRDYVCAFEQNDV